MATATRSIKPTRTEVEALIERLGKSNRIYHGGTHPDLIAAISMLERLMPANKGQHDGSTPSPAVQPGKDPG